MKKIIFFGDSITENGGASHPDNAYNHLIAAQGEYEVFSAGCGGSRFTRVRKPSPFHRFNMDFNTRVHILPRRCDMIVVFGGTNDYGGGVPLGEIGDGTVYTLAGAMSRLIETLTLMYGKEKIRFVLPLKRYNCDKPSENGTLPMIDYVNKMREVLNHYEIPYLDLYELGPDAPLDEEKHGYFADGLHPTDLGHAFIAKEMVKFIKETENK